MSLGLAVFIACTAIAATWTVVACVLTARTLGGSAAAKEGAVLAVSLGAYVGVSVWLGYGIGQFAALAASLLPLRIGRRYLTPRYDHMRGDQS